MKKPSILIAGAAGAAGAASAAAATGLAQVPEFFARTRKQQVR